MTAPVTRCRARVGEWHCPADRAEGSRFCVQHGEVYAALARARGEDPSRGDAPAASEGGA